MMIDIITILVSVQNARVSSNAHPNRASTPPLDARFWPRIAPLHKTPKTTTRDAHDSKTHTREKKRETKTTMKMMIQERGKKRRKTKKKTTMKNNRRRRRRPHPLYKSASYPCCVSNSAFKSSGDAFAMATIDSDLINEDHKTYIFF